MPTERRSKAKGKPKPNATARSPTLVVVPTTTLSPTLYDEDNIASTGTSTTFPLPLDEWQAAAALQSLHSCLSRMRTRIVAGFTASTMPSVLVLLSIASKVSNCKAHFTICKGTILFLKRIRFFDYFVTIFVETFYNSAFLNVCCLLQKRSLTGCNRLPMFSCNT